MFSKSQEPAAQRPLIFGAVADDLTGGLELASGLVAAGVRTDFRIGPPSIEDVVDGSAAVVALKTRVAAKSDAVRQVERAMDWLVVHQARQLFLKYCATFDSTDEGNIGCSADVLIEATGADRLIFCPSFPKNNRTVYNGHMFLGDVLLSNSAKRNDPLTPMNDPDLRSVLSRQTDRAVGHLPKSVLDLGQDRMAKWVDDLVAAAKDYIIADAIDDDDLARIAQFTQDWKAMSGNTTIALHYPSLWRARGLLANETGPDQISRTNGPGAVLVGSVAEQSLHQLEVFRAHGHPVFSIDLLTADNTASVVDEIMNWVSSQGGEREVAISTAASTADVQRVHESMGRFASAQAAEDILSRVASALVRRGTNRLVVAGGETSGAVVQALGLRKLIVGPQPAHGIPLAQADVGGRALTLSLKSGKLGDENVFAERLRAMVAEAS